MVSDQAAIDAEVQKFKPDIDTKLSPSKVSLDEVTRRVKMGEKEREQLFLFKESPKAQFLHGPDDNEKVDDL